ncbi:hypothetical protein Nos7524_3984 [Nostoc sp. PCC 7524]|uniref:hypothetical protein n=1 Tax=Nostoc sp. (strain ATCC 29411 / PCC 7524) TaxID=28072 RepID=UPI00029ED5AB|nr:hypothetical protein [Nostoc sp. PCC 7524]AFY49757.1 hypothetical protein Nos7524_3984 [Nostoc sp. PCC 7524]
MSNINTTSQVLNNIAGVEDLNNEQAEAISAGGWLGMGLTTLARLGYATYNYFTWKPSRSTLNRWKRNPNTMVRDFGAKVLFGAPL